MIGKSTKSFVALSFINSQEKKEELFRLLLDSIKPLEQSQFNPLDQIK